MLVSLAAFSNLFQGFSPLNECVFKYAQNCSCRNFGEYY
jgi:hypothetical protein